MRPITERWHIFAFAGKRGGQSLAAMMACVLTALAQSLPAQTGPDFGNAAQPVLLGSFSVRLNSPQAAVDAAQQDNDPDLFVEGPISLRAVIHRQDPDSYRESGQPDLPDLDGSKSIRKETIRITSKNIIKGVLAANGIDDPRGYSLMWRGGSQSMSKGFSEKLVNEGLSSLVVGIKGRAQRFSAAEFLNLFFAGGEGRTDSSLLETGSYTIRPNPEGNPPRNESAQRQGFVYFAARVKAPLPGGDIPFNLTGLLRIERTLRTNQRIELGDALLGKTFESGVISGPIFGLYSEP